MKLIFDFDEDEVIEHFNKRDSIRTIEKNEFGEVFTPIKLINEILDRLPKSIWSNEKLKWLDPAAGLGQFPAAIYLRLLQGLKQKIPNLKNRQLHIVKNMLFMVELNSKSAKDIRSLFGNTCNISNCDFLEDSVQWKKDLDHSQFDIVIGNPPFQSSKASDYKGGTGKNTLWDKFVVNIISSAILSETGYLAFITPASWRRPESDLYDIMTRKNKLLFLHIYGKTDGVHYFGIQSRFDVYIIEKQNNQKHYLLDTLIDEKGKMYNKFPILSWPFLPNYAFNSIHKILCSPEKGIPVIFDSSYYYYAHPISKNKTGKKIFPIVHGIVSDGLVIKYSDVKNPQQFGVKKVLLNFNERQYPFNDFTGKYGMSQLTFGIPITSKAHGEKISKAILSPQFKEILDATKWGAFQTDYRMFKYFTPNFYSNINNKTRSKKTTLRNTRKIR